MDAGIKISRAISRLIFKYPFFASIVLRLPLKEDISCPTGYIDGTVIAYSPHWINSLTTKEVEFFLCHEALHLALLHHLRRGRRVPARWNLAGDYVINSILKEDGFQLQPKAPYDSRFKKMSTEEVYEELPTPPKIGLGGVINLDPGGCGEVRDYPGADGGKASRDEIFRAEAACLNIINKAARDAKAQGNCPANLDRIIQDIRPGVVNWKEILSVFLTESARSDYTWKFPNPRYMSAGIYLPSPGQKKCGRIVIFIDTSGSINEIEMVSFVSEVHELVTAFDVEIYVVYVDCAVAGVEVITGWDVPLNLHPKGGGGTDYRPGFDWVERKGIEPVCAVYFTDGFCWSFPEKEPDYPVLWAVTVDGAGYNFSAPWGEIQEIA